jgi:hypothetical protein
MDDGPPTSWPYPRLRQRFPDWNRSPAAYVQKDFPAAAVQSNPLGGTRKVIVRRGRLTPEAVPDSEAIVLPIDFYQQNQSQWPVGARILLLAPPDQAGQLHGHTDKVVFLGHRHAPLGHVLERITETCAELAVSRVSSVGIGYEDEGPELDKWRRQQGIPLELTIYCEHEGDVASFGPYADVIQ